MALKNARFVKYPVDPLDFDAPNTVVRKLTPQEVGILVEQLLEGMGGDRLVDLLANIAQQATRGQADFIEWD